MNRSEDTSGIDVAYVAHLARIHLTEKEISAFQDQLGHIVEHVRRLGELDVEGVEPTAHAVDLRNALRKDEVREGLDHATAMANAPASRGGQFLVPRIIE